MAGSIIKQKLGWCVFSKLDLATQKILTGIKGECDRKKQYWDSPIWKLFHLSFTWSYARAENCDISAWWISAQGQIYQVLNSVILVLHLQLSNWNIIKENCDISAWWISAQEDIYQATTEKPKKWWEIFLAWKINSFLYKR